MNTTVKYDNFSFHAADAGTTIYTSDFSADEDGWGAKHAAAEVSSTSFAGEVALKIKLDTATVSHYLSRPISFIEGKEYKLTGKVYLPDGQTTDGWKIMTWPGADPVHDCYSPSAGGNCTPDEWREFSVEFTAESSSDGIYIFGIDGGTGTYTPGSNDIIYITDFVLTEITDGFPTPYVSRSQAPVSYGNRWGQETSYTLNGQITGYSFDDLINKQNILLSGFARDYKSLDITEDGESVAGFPAKNCRINSVDFGGSKYANIIDYDIGIISQDESLFSGTYGVMDPSDQINISESSDGKISVTHEVSARGVPANNKSSIDNAKDFVHAHSGWKGHLVPHFIKYQDTKVAVTYFSDFTSSTDGTHPSYGSRTAGVTIGGEANCLKYLANDTDTSDHFVYRGNTLTIGTKYRIKAKIYIGNGTYQTINYVEISDQGAAGAGLIAEVNGRGSWKDVEKEFVAASDTLYFKAKESSTDYTFLGDGNLDDWFAIRNVEIQEAFDFSPILISQNESINRMNGVYSMNESYSLSSTGENTLISGHTVSISSGADQDFTTVELAANYKGSLGEHIEQVRGKIPSVTSNAYYEIASELSQIDSLNTGAINFSISENSGASSIEVSASYDNNKLFTGSNAYFDYSVSSSTNELDSRTSISVNGTIQARGNKFKTAENFLETNINNFTSDGCNHEAKHACYLYSLANQEYNNLSKPYSLDPYPKSCTLSKNETEGTITLSASFTDDYVPSNNVKSANWSISVTPPLRKYISTSDVITYPKHIFWNTDVLTRSNIQVNASASSYDSINKSYGLTTVDSFIENVYNTYIGVNSDIAMQGNSLSFNEIDLAYKRNKSWSFHNSEEWVTLPAPPKP